jgi:general secretion pathway protein G
MVRARHLTAGGASGRGGFTLIELLVVMAIIATLLTIAVPRYFGSIDRSKEAVLKQNLRSIRDAIDKYYADNERYPETLEALAAGRYLRDVPVDPVTGSAATWIIVPPRVEVATGRPGERIEVRPDDRGALRADDRSASRVYDVKSGAPGTASDGTVYGEW